MFAEPHVYMHEHDINAAETTRQLQGSNLKKTTRLLHHHRLVNAVGWIFETGISTVTAGFRANSARPTAAEDSVTFPLWFQAAGSSQSSKGTLSRALPHALVHALAITDLVLCGFIASIAWYIGLLCHLSRSASATRCTG